MLVVTLVIHSELAPGILDRGQAVGVADGGSVLGGVGTNGADCRRQSQAR